MYKFFALAFAAVLATIPSASAAVATKSCPCYVATVTTTPEVCPLCMPANCLVYPTITTTIPGPNPTCTTTSTKTITSGCPCGSDTCPTAWETVTGTFTCKRGGTKETNLGGAPGGAVTETASVTASVSETGIFSILPIETLTPEAP